MSAIRTALALVALVVLFGIVGRMDYDDAVKDEQHYCEMVKAGAWPAYRDGVDCGVHR